MTITTITPVTITAIIQPAKPLITAAQSPVVHV
jgi:hypothetical protein